jgi:hypothetical protein
MSTLNCYRCARQVSKETLMWCRHGAIAIKSRTTGIRHHHIILSMAAEQVKYNARSSMLSNSLFRSFLPLSTKLTFSTTSETATNDHKMSDSNSRSIVPPEDYYEGHLMTDHLEYLDDILEKTVRIENSLDELLVAYAKKKELLSTSTNVNWMGSHEIQDLFVSSSLQKKQMQQELSELKVLLQEAKEAALKKSLVGVDAPDGISDDMIQQDMKAIEEIIDYAKLHENKNVIETIHDNEFRDYEDARKITAVDAPDGIPDALMREHLNELKSEAKSTT